MLQKVTKVSDVTKIHIKVTNLKKVLQKVAIKFR